MHLLTAAPLQHLSNKNYLYYYSVCVKASVNENSIRNTFTDCIHVMCIVLVCVLA